MTVLFLTRMIDYFEKRIEDLRAEFPNVAFVVPKNRAEAEELLPKAEAVVTGHLTEEQVRKASKLRVIFVPWAGVNALPLDVIKQRGIIVSNNHGNGKIVAERAIALALAVMGRIVEFHNDLAKGIWHGYEAGARKEDFWFSLQNKKVSILGLGTIGKHIAKLLKGFDCEIMGYKKTVEPVELVDHVTNNLEEAIAFGKVIFVALPLTSETRGIISSEILRTMHGKFLINVGRGELIDERGLYEALRDGILAGAGIDTWYLYPEGEETVRLPSRYPIHTLKNVVISPHVGGFTIEGQMGRIDETVENIRHYLLTGRPLNVVDLEREY
ncbi:2-hydroxyacid dehydrogenase [Fervidobacterium thailandense]|uniref:Hydroxyacid dehydrogenase n=1 Tax=Fervidobacterium thailandense TaxID=1008305 RepID=A0A1E3G4Y1_9BACT|nr:2-hydroxyacid dehydrogenase [Fervidobacterium thailandense]ODN31190.1 hydroxyacid dehydrogenase [Fervidobacterium thailandense]